MSPVDPAVVEVPAVETGGAEPDVVEVPKVDVAKADVAVAEPAVAEPAVAEPAEHHEADPEVRCARCGHGVARHGDAITVDGSHRHTFRNPSGYSYQLACFADAPGCSAAGELTDEHTWFAGHQWALALCGMCGTHVGWWFVGAGGSFAGLIVPRVR